DFTLMAEKQLEILRGYELRLLRCTLAPPPSDHRIQSQPLNEESQCSLLPLHEHINSLIDSNESGHYLQALYSDAAKLVLHTLDFVDINDSAECADRVYSELLQLVEAFIVNDSENDVDKACRVILLMCLSIAALFWFTQCNVTGSCLLALTCWESSPIFRKHFESAEVAAGLQLSVTGVLGFRTVHQVEPKAQMVLVANTSSSNTSDVCPSINQVIHTHDSTIGDASDVFVTPKLLGNSHESESGVQ
ncbi:hypothetical protein CUMW_245380, partial [Citrus unshiu]